MGTPGPACPAQMRAPPAPPFPAAVGWELERIEARLQQHADSRARQMLVDVGEAAALRVLRLIGESRKPVRNFSGYIMWAARNAPDAPSAESAVYGSGPSSGDDSVLGPMHDDVQMEDGAPSSESAFNLSNHARIEVESPARQTPHGLHGDGNPVGVVASLLTNPVAMEVDKPGCNVPEMSPVMPNQGGMEEFVEHLSFRMQDQVQPLQVDSLTPPFVHGVPDSAMVQVGSPGVGMVSGLQQQVGFDSPVRRIIPTSPRMASTPSPVREITRRIHQMGCPSGTAAVQASPTMECMMLADSLVTANTSRATVSCQMLALGELEFVRIFLIYVYLGGKKVEDVGVLHEDYIRSLNSLPMDRFELDIWNKFGHEFLAECDRRQNLDWDPSKTRVYHCNIEQRGDSIVTVFKGPYIENTRTSLQKVVGDDNVLVVNFSDISGHTNAGDNFETSCHFYHHVFEDGIILGLRRYRFLIHKDGGREKRIKAEKKKERNKKCTSSVRCYFVRTECGWDKCVPYILSNRTIGDARKLFMHVHTAPSIAKYVARFGLVLSKTITLLDDEDLSKVDVVTVDDVPCKDENGSIVLKHKEVLIHTDGTGLISEDLAKKCHTSVSKGNLLSVHDDSVDSKEDQFDIDDHPLLMQVRMFYNGLAVKGTLLVVRELPERTIHIRPSMIKVNSDPSLSGGHSFNSLEIVSTSNRPKRALTSRFLIALLHYGGVPADYFMELLGKALKDVEKARHKTRDSLEVAFNHGDMDDLMSARMILSGIRPEDEAYLQHQLTTMTKEEREGFKQGRLPVDQCYYLMGTTDPTGTLKPHEVCVILDHGPISGEVLVYRHPGLHFGDIHVLTATYSEAIQDLVGDSKYAILFPVSGPRSLADEMGGGDFDGDMYWVSRNPQLLKYFKPSEPWDQRNPPRKAKQEKPQDYDESKLEHILFREFFRTRFTPSYVLGAAADCWVVYMDRLLTCEVQEDNKEWESIKAKMLELVDIYYEALDAPKSGNKITMPRHLRVAVYPHFMEGKGFTRPYTSTSVLGKIYDKAKSHQPQTVHPINITPLTCFTEEVVDEERNLWGLRYDEYRRVSTSLLDCNHPISKENKKARFREMDQKYKQMLYDAAKPEESKKHPFAVYREACAIYQLVYEHAVRCRCDDEGRRVERCGFAWRVAGRALCEFYVIKRRCDRVVADIQVLRDAFRKDRSA
ncbi:probable RNA-dependent RNA polymerase 3 isoform X1 [Hordeum vulgare subsp. vulgare]|uniref:RNA-dependent RNA polymerase n=1 Tax=Hordeum vulgare subsp. vulgare TaxID=112509 RepID=A0A8I6WXV7_HORVV|nr:probable RNA-dependent RNA polymerase 3 isoform X1 [Hordeum vulgare subsp. vulgare]